jgi:hypothetical protein
MKCSQSSYSQQVAWLQQQNRNIDPISAYKHNLFQEEAISWKQQNTYVIIAGNVRNHTYSEELLFDLLIKVGVVPATTNHS